VLHLPRRFSVASPRCLLLLRMPAGHPPRLTPLPDAGDVRGRVGNLRAKADGEGTGDPERHARR
jgi:hypothetical protein